MTLMVKTANLKSKSNFKIKVDFLNKEINKRGFQYSNNLHKKKALSYITS